MAVIRIHLAAEDLKRYGLTEGPLFDPSVLMELEAEILQEQVPGFDPDGWFDFLRGESRHIRRVVLWCALRRAGIHVPYAEIDYDRHSYWYEDAATGEPEGKDQTSTSDSSPEPNADSTNPSSPTSTESSPSDMTETPSGL